MSYSAHPTPQAPLAAVAAGRSVVPGKSRRRPREELIVTGFGMASSSLVAFGAWAVAHYLGFSPSAWTVNMFPLGAILCGLVGAAGYWIGSRLFNHRPVHALLANFVLLSFSTFYAIYYVDQMHVTVKRPPLESIVPFGLQLVILTEKWGWNGVMLQVIGFLLGALLAYYILAALPYCDRCSRYFSPSSTRMAHWEDVKLMQAEAAPIVQSMETGGLQLAIDKHARLCDLRKLRRDCQRRGSLIMELSKCPNCKRQRLRFIARHWNRKYLRKQFRLAAVTEDPLTMEHPNQRASSAARAFRETYGIDWGSWEK